MKTKQGVISFLYRKEDIAKLDRKIKMFGINHKMSTEMFLNIRFFLSVLVFLVVFLFFNNGFLYAPVFAVVFYFSFTYYIIDYQLKKRSRKLEHEAFYFFEVLTLSLESGRNLEMAIDSACTYIDSEIAEEFRQTLYEVKFGKSLTEALEEMRYRIPSEVVNNIILNIMQSSLFGSNILDTMYNQLDFLREKQILDIKGEIAKIPTKISVFSVIFFVPLILLIILAPLLIEYIMSS